MGAVATLRVGADLMRARGKGRLVGVSSMAGVRGFAGSALSRPIRRNSRPRSFLKTEAGVFQ